MAPPLLSKSEQGQRPKKIRLGARLLPAMMARARQALRGTALDRSAAPKNGVMNEAIVAFEASRVAELLPQLDAGAPAAGGAGGEAARSRCAASGR